MNQGKITEGKVLAVCISDVKGVPKKDIGEGVLVTHYGLDGDAHASSAWHRQVSLLAIESIDKMRKAGYAVEPGSFAENITCQGIDLVALPLGTELKIGEEVVLRISQIGKECHTGCAVFRQTGACIMPREGVFAEVIRGGKVRAGDPITLVER